MKVIYFRRLRMNWKLIFLHLLRFFSKKKNEKQIFVLRKPKTVLNFANFHLFYWNFFFSQIIIHTVGLHCSKAPAISVFDILFILRSLSLSLSFCKPKKIFREKHIWIASRYDMTWKQNGIEHNQLSFSFLSIRCVCVISWILFM